MVCVNSGEEKYNDKSGVIFCRYYCKS